MTWFERAIHAGSRLLHRRHGTGRDSTSDPSGMGMSGETYDRFTRVVLRDLHARVARDVCAAPAEATALDVGAGTGRLLRVVAAQRSDLSLTGVDVSPKMVAVGQRALAAAGLAERVRLDTADVSQLPYPDAHFDLVVSTLSLHHWPALAPSMAELLRVLRPGGRIVIYDFRASQVQQLGQVLRTVHQTGLRVSQRPVPLARWLPVPLLLRVEVSSEPASRPSPP